MCLSRSLLLAFLVISTTGYSQTGQNAASLSCWGLSGSFQSRSARTPFYRSDSGIAYAEVTANAITAGDTKNCSNNTRLFYSRNGKHYRLVWSGHEEFNGLGITIYGWSHTGKLLLFQTRTWPYESDADEVRRGLVFDSMRGKVRDLKLASAFTHILGSKCEFEHTVLGWESDDSISVRISRPPLTEHYDQVFCVKAPVDYTFNLGTGAVTRKR